jgi:hypothetical protein
MSFSLFQQIYLELVTILIQNIIAQHKNLTVIQLQHLLKYLQEYLLNAHIHLEWILFGQLQIID